MNITEAFAIYETRKLATKTEKTRKNYHSVHNCLLKGLGNIPIELIGDEQLAIWDGFMVEDGKTGTTRRSYFIIFKKILCYFKRFGVISYDPNYYEMPENDTKPRVFLEPNEVERLIAAAKNVRDKAIIACVFLSGCRISEILNLDKTDLCSYVDAEGCQSVTVKGKNGKYREVLFNETARMYLYNYLETRNDRYRELFVSGQNRRITVSRVEQIVHQCARDARMEKRVTPHILRHSFATDLLNNEAQIYDVSKALGHANISTTANIYGHFDTKGMKRVLSTRQSKIGIV